jgi:hypothetical protein
MSKNELEKMESLQQFAENLPNKSNMELANELAAIELEEKQLDLEIKRETVAKIRAQRNAKLDEARVKMQSIKQFLATREAVQSHCNHKKGGQGANAVINGEGTDANFAIIKHKMPHGRYQIFCQRCGKEWKPAVQILGEVETPGYREMLNAQTDNSPSGSSVFLFERVEASA